MVIEQTRLECQIDWLSMPGHACLEVIMDRNASPHREADLSGIRSTAGPALRI